MKPTFIPILCAALIATSAATQAAENGRYQLQQTPNGVVRLDTQTGELSYCHEADGTLSCASNEGEDVLRQKIETLEARIAALEARLSDKDLPSDEELERGFSIMENFMKRFKDFADELEGKTPDQPQVLPQKI